MSRPADTLAVVESIANLRAALAPLRRTGSIGLVPTMGALHRGHARLIEQARAENEAVAVTIFVNPLQFDRKDDLQRYPRTLEHDVELCRQLGVDLIFAPPAEEMYQGEPRCTVRLTRIGDHLCGRYRPGHFEGVATIVLKLFNCVEADRAYFGQKDAQQLAIVKRMVRDFNLPVSIVSVPTVREPDGLALSSRNAHLDPEERGMARFLYEALCTARRQIAAGMRDAARVTAVAAGTIPDEEKLRLEYLEIVEPDELQPVARIDGPVLIAGALWVGRTRLIDNVSWP